MEPFTLEEVQRFLAAVRADFRPYYTVRFFTGMRTGEIDGLKWKYVDFKRREILVRETFVMGREDYTKNDHSQREIAMSEPVYDALREQHERTKGRTLRVLHRSRPSVELPQRGQAHLAPFSPSSGHDTAKALSDPAHGGDAVVGRRREPRMDCPADGTCDN